VVGVVRCLNWFTCGDTAFLFKAAILGFAFLGLLGFVDLTSTGKMAVDVASGFFQ